MENTEFQVHSSYGHKALKTMVRALRKTARRKWSVALRVFGWFAVTLFALAEIALAALGAFSFGFSDALAFLVVGVMVVLLLFEDDLNAWIAAFTVIPGGKDADTRFASDAYTVTTQTAETRWDYGAVTTFCETPDSFVFLLGKRHGQQFPKAGFSEGTPEEFRGFIAEKTGLSVRYVK